MTEVGGFTFLPQDDPADWEPGGVSWQRSADVLEAVAGMARGLADGPVVHTFLDTDGTAQMAVLQKRNPTAEPSRDALVDARRRVARQVAIDAAKRMERLAESLERPPTMDGIERERCDAAALAYRESARIVREEGGAADV